MGESGRAWARMEEGKPPLMFTGLIVGRGEVSVTALTTGMEVDRAVTGRRAEGLGTGVMGDWEEAAGSEGGGGAVEEGNEGSSSSTSSAVSCQKHTGSSSSSGWV